MKDQNQRRQFVVVAYDVVSDARRVRLHQKLKEFGTPVQYSVFECLLDQGTLERLIAMVKREISDEEDTVRIYFLCRSCRRKTYVINGEVTDIPPAIIV